MRALAVAAALLVVSPAAAGPCKGSRAFFPLEQGNRWTFAEERFGEDATLAAAAAGQGVFRLTGFPGAPALRVRWAGETLQAWDTRQRRWEPFLRLGARKGTTYRVELPHDAWQGARVTVASRSATLASPRLGRRHTGVVRLAVTPPPGLADAGVTALWFARGIGPLGWDELRFSGTVEHRLAQARVGSKTLG